MGNCIVATRSFKKPILLFSKLVRISEDHKKKKEVDFDLLSTIAPLTAQSCNYMTSVLRVLSVLFLNIQDK
jgi:hypothetical protein